MNDTDTNVTDDPDPDDLNGLAASLDHLRLWCELDRAGAFCAWLTTTARKSRGCEKGRPGSFETRGMGYARAVKSQLVQQALWGGTVVRFNCEKYTGPFLAKVFIRGFSA
jgi:hypothetical protein